MAVSVTVSLACHFVWQHRQYQKLHYEAAAAAGQYFRGYDQYIRPIHMAAYEARPDLMRLLLAGGASVEAPDRKGRTPVQCVLAPTFFDGESLVGRASKTTARQRLTLQVDAVFMLCTCRQISTPRIFACIFLSHKCLLAGSF